MVPIIDSDSILLLGYSILYKEYNLTRFKHQKDTTYFLSPNYGPLTHCACRALWVVEAGI